MLLLIVFDKFQLGFTTRAIKFAILLSSSPEAIHSIHYICTNSYFLISSKTHERITHTRLNMYPYQLYIYTYIKIVGWWHVDYFGWRSAREKNLFARPRGFCQTSRYLLNRYTRARNGPNTKRYL